jgi:hypothetical protein
MQSYGTTPADNTRKSGSTQPRPTGGSDGRNPGQGTGGIPSVVGKETPQIVKTGATNNG